MSTAQFDFLAYLSRFDPHVYEIKPLAGGLVNLTVRATKLHVDQGPQEQTALARSLKRCPFDGHETLILKYAPPFVAAVGDAAPLSTYRQVIEKRALNWIPSAPEIRSAQTITNVSIPRVIFADSECSVLVVTDLGADLLTLDQWLIPSLCPDKSLLPPDVSTCRNVGARVGQLLAAIHSSAGLHGSFQDFINPDAVRLVRSEVVDKIEPLLEAFGIGLDDRTRWCAAIRADFDTGCVYRDHHVFSVGDLWPGSLLVGAQGGSHEPAIGLVDWEFAGPGRPLQDMAQLCAHLRLLAMAIPPDAHAALEGFSNALRASYFSHARALKPAAVRDAAMRSAWILHGRELIYNATERYHQVALDLGASEVQAAERVRNMVRCGIGYIRGVVDGTAEEWNQETFLRALCFSENDDEPLDLGVHLT